MNISETQSTSYNIALDIIDYTTVVLNITIMLLSIATLLPPKQLKIRKKHFNIDHLLRTLYLLCIMINLSTAINSIKDQKIAFIITSYAWIVLTLIVTGISIKSIFFDNAKTDKDYIGMLYYVLPIILFANLLYISISWIFARKYMFYKDFDLITTIACMFLASLTSFKNNKRICLWLMIYSIMISLILIAQSQYAIYYE